VPSDLLKRRDFAARGAAANRLWCTLLLSLFIFSPDAAKSQAPDFLHPQQKGPFQVNGLQWVEFPTHGWQSGYLDPVNLGSGYSVPTLDQIIPEIKATGANVVKFTMGGGQVKNYTDNAYDPALPFPLDGKFSDILAFRQKLQGIPCWLDSLFTVENVNEASPTAPNPRIHPSDPRAFMMQHVPRLVSLAQFAESMGCEYFSLFGDDTEPLAIDPSVTDLWVQAITQVRAVFSGRVIAESGWRFDNQPQIISMLDILGSGLLLSSTGHPDPTVAELVAAYQKNADGVDILKAITSFRTLYQKPFLITDNGLASFKGSNTIGAGVITDPVPAGQFTVDYQEQANEYQATFQALRNLDPNWMLGSYFHEFDRFPYAWKDAALPPYFGTLGVALRGKPALQTLTQAYQASQPLTTPANGWWFNPTTPGTFYAMESENDVVRLASLTYSTKGDPQWSLARCVQIAPGTYAGTMEQYSGGWALNQKSAPPTAIVDGPAVKLVFNNAATATLQVGTQSMPIQRYQFSDQWASPMLNAPRSGWWDQTTQSGRGYFLEVQGNTLFVGGLIYGSSGQPSWFTSTGPVDSTGAFSGNLTVCFAQANADGTLQAPVCKATADMIRLAFSVPWRATLSLGQENPVEIRRYRQAEIGWAGPAPAFALPNPAFLGQSATVNAASFATGVAPGSIGTIFGTGLTRGVNGVVQAPSGPPPYSLRGTSVLVNGIPAPIFAIANVNGQEQINFQVPWEVQGEPIPPQAGLTPITVTKDPAVTIVVVNNGALSPPMRALFSAIQPAIITSDGMHAVAVHADYSLVTNQNPARPGDVITLYGVGFGPVTPLPATGAPAGGSPPSVMNPNPIVGISAHNATVQFAGLSPGSVGLYQFNIVVPDGLGIGDLPALITAGGQVSNVFSLPVQGQPGVQNEIEIIKNGSFESPVIPAWIEYVDSNSTAKATFERTTSTAHDGNYSEHVSVTTAGTTGNVQLLQLGISVVQGTSYLFQFWVKSSNTRNLGVGILSNADFHSYGLQTVITLGNSDWQLYRATFQATETNIGRLEFYFGDQTGDVWLDSVSLQAVAGPGN
jgi:uncharacterized protein (TIGR03437 family)